MMKIIRDKNGEVINIGEWDFKYEEVDTGLIDTDGVPVFRRVPTNPMPDGAYEDMAEVEYSPDGSRRAVIAEWLTDPRFAAYAARERKKRQ